MMMMMRSGMHVRALFLKSASLDVRIAAWLLLMMMMVFVISPLSFQSVCVLLDEDTKTHIGTGLGESHSTKLKLNEN